MLRRFKYLLLRWLLNDICRKSDCSTCPLDGRNVPPIRWCPCAENEIYRAARLVWEIECKTYSELLLEDDE
jgi:hypothetical protein